MLRLLILFCLPAWAWSFSEDICYLYSLDDLSSLNTDQIVPQAFNCNDLECTDGLDGGQDGLQCVINGVQTLVLADMLYKIHGRNSIHFDTVWLLARAAGLNEEDSRQVASFAEATDLGQYHHYDLNGQLMPEWEYESIYGLSRTNEETSGFWLHFVPWFRFADDEAKQYSLTYTEAPAEQSPFADREVPLNHIRSWAFGQRKSLCQFGLTQDNGDCYDQQYQGQLNFSLTMIYPIVEEGQIQLGRQLIHPNGDGYESDYDQQIQGSPKALGIYLHALQDRLSHFQCSNYSAIESLYPNARIAYYQLNYATTCGTLLHLTMHYKETGQGQSPPRTINAVYYSWSEIQAWMEATQYGSSSSLSSNQQQKMLKDIVEQALPKSCAAQRLKALCQIAQSYGLGWHDRQQSHCQYQNLNCE